MNNSQALTHNQKSNLVSSFCGLLGGANAFGLGYFAAAIAKYNYNFPYYKEIKYGTVLLGLCGGWAVGKLIFPNIKKHSKNELKRINPQLNLILDKVEFPQEFFNLIDQSYAECQRIQVYGQLKSLRKKLLYCLNSLQSINTNVEISNLVSLMKSKLVLVNKAILLIKQDPNWNEGCESQAVMLEISTKLDETQSYLFWHDLFTWLKIPMPLFIWQLIKPV
jgi:hypothetical protein